MAKDLKPGSEIDGFTLGARVAAARMERAG
jgi:hypothetical protein